MSDEPPKEVVRAIAHRFWETQAASAHDARSVTLDKVPGFLSRFEVSLYQGWFLRQLAPHQPRPALTVDIGCGNGQWTAVLARISQRVVAFDFSQGFVEACRRRMEQAGVGERVTVLQGDAESAPLPAGADLIVAGAVVQYLGDVEVEALLARVHVALAPGGVCYLRTTVSKTGVTQTSLTDSFQGIYRPIEWYDQRLAAAGFQVLRRSTATDFVPEEFGARTLRMLYYPFHLIWRAARWRKKTDVAAFLVRRSE